MNTIAKALTRVGYNYVTWGWDYVKESVYFRFDNETDSFIEGDMVLPELVDGQLPDFYYYRQVEASDIEALDCAGLLADFLKETFPVESTIDMYDILRITSHKVATLENVFCYSVDKDRRFYEILLHEEPTEFVKMICRAYDFSIVKNVLHNGEQQADVWEIRPLNVNKINFIEDEN